MKQVQRFKCDFCNRITARADTMERHEIECVHNPNTVNCFMCEFSCIDDYEIDEPWGATTAHDVPQCIYTEDMLHRGDALECEKFVRSKELNFARDRKTAEENYERYKEGAVKDE